MFSTLNNAISSKYISYIIKITSTYVIILYTNKKILERFHAISILNIAPDVGIIYHIYTIFNFVYIYKMKKIHTV